VEVLGFKEGLESDCLMQCKVLCDLHARGKFERSLNATFIVLIPKKRGC
jgi:hypothetical protein